MKSKRVYQSERQLQRQANILYITRKLASKVGYEGLTMRGLAEAAEVSPKTLYNLFNSKDELLSAALADLQGIIKKNSTERSMLKGFDHILAVRKASSEIIARSPGFANVIVSLFFRARPEDLVVSTLFEGYKGSTLGGLEYEKQAGNLIEGIDPQKTANHLSAQTWGVLLSWDKGLLDLQNIMLVERRAYVMSFCGISIGERQKQMEQELLRLNKHSDQQPKSEQTG